MNPLIDVQHLHLTVPTGHIIQGEKNILNDISFKLEAGTSTAYLGANGAGKTSTFRILCGLVKPNSGKVYFDGHEVSRGLPAKRFGFMPEQPYFYKNLSPFELLNGLGRLSGLSGSQLQQRIFHWAEKLHFSNVLNQRLSTCSKGQVQRVGLAQALIHQPDFILLDEPLSGLDPIGRSCVREVLLEERKRGATLLFSSHILSDAESLCDQVIVLKEGQTIFTGNIQSLLSSQTSWLIKAHWTDTPPSTTAAEMTQLIDGNWQIRGDSYEERDAILKQLLSNPNASILSLETEQRTLEQAFIELLQKQGTSL